MNGIHEVTGSTPVRSTNLTPPASIPAHDSNDIAAQRHA